MSKVSQVEACYLIRHAFYCISHKGCLVSAYRMLAAEQRLKDLGYHRLGLSLIANVAAEISLPPSFILPIQQPIDPWE